MKPVVAERGFSLVEIILTIVIISIALIAAIQGWSMMARHSADVMWQSKTAYLGQAYLEEILSKRYDELTPIGGIPPCSSCSEPSTFAVTSLSPITSGDGESRAEFDDVDDYHQLQEPGIGLFNTLLSLSDPHPYQGYQVEVDVSYVGDSYFGSGNERKVKQVTVTVTPPVNTEQSAVTFTALRGNY